MRKKRFLIFFLLIGSLSFGVETRVQTSQVTVINFDSNKIASALEDSLYKNVSNVIDEIFGGVNVPIVNESLAGLLKNILSGFVCPQYNLPSFSKSVTVPSLLEISLPCRTVTVNLSPATSQALSNSNLVEIGRNFDNEIANCIRFPERCENEKVKRLLQVKSPLANFELEGISKGNDYADKDIKQVLQEIKDTTKIMSISDVQYLKGNPEQVSVNEASQNIRLAKMNEASSSFYGWIAPSKEEFANENAVLKPYYNAIASKQIARREYIYSLEEILRRERKRLAQIASIVKGVCNAKWKVPVIRKQYLGRIGKPTFAFASAKRTVPKVPKRDKNVLNICLNTHPMADTNWLDFKTESINPNRIARLFGGGDDCPCCPCFTIKGYVDEAKAEVLARITEAEHLLASVISNEMYATREQINADAQAIAETLRKIECVKANLEYQRNYLMTLQLETQIATLKAIYSLLNKEEVSTYEELKAEVEKQLQR